MRFSLVVLLAWVAVSAGAQEPAYPRPGDGLKWSCEWTQNVAQPDAFVFPRLSDDLQTVRVLLSNWRENPIQAVLQEWSLSMDGEVSALVLVETRNGDVQTISVPPVNVPGHGESRFEFMPRKRHHWDQWQQRFALAPILETACVYPPRVRPVILTYSIVDGSEKILRSVRIDVLFAYKATRPAS